MVRLSFTTTLLLSLVAAGSAQRWTTIFKTVWETEFVAPTAIAASQQNSAGPAVTQLNAFYNKQAGRGSKQWGRPSSQGGVSNTAVAPPASSAAPPPSSSNNQPASSNPAPASSSAATTSGGSGNAGGYSLHKSYDTSNFFDGFTFYTDADPTHGQVEFLDRDTAGQKGLAFCADGSCKMKVDSSTNLAEGVARQSVRIESNEAYNNGLFVLDVNHVPTGCASWPAFWFLGPDWPNGGEIDVFETVHDQANNQFALHTSSGCTAGANDMTGTLGHVDCLGDHAENIGCQIYSGKAGAGFKGQIATQWTTEFIKIWMFDEGQAPADIGSSSPDPSTWGKPTGWYSSSTCNIAEKFKDLKIIINITLCGDWAGNSPTPACSNSCSSYVMTGSNFAETYWDIKSLKVYQK